MPSGYTTIPSNPYVEFENLESFSWNLASLPRPWKDKMTGTFLLESYVLGMWMRYLRGDTPLELSMVRLADLPSLTLSGSDLGHLFESLTARELMLGTSDKKTELRRRGDSIFWVLIEGLN